MWSSLPSDLLANIFSYLSPDSLARAKTACRNWHASAEFAAVSASPHRHPPWFVAMPTRSSRGRVSCYTHNPIENKWHIFVPLDHHTIYPIKPIATIHGLILSRLLSHTTSLQLALSNPFTNQFKILPPLNVTRTNPAVGVVLGSKFGLFKIYVAGGMSETNNGGAVYQPSIEMYDSFQDKWKIIGPMPVEFAVRLTVWTPNESVYSKGILYWMTSARAYSVMGFEIETNKWRELGVPMADKLEFAALVPKKNGKLAIIGGVCGGDASVWEFGELGEIWSLVDKVPVELGIRFLGDGDKLNWGGVKCVGIDGAICLYKDLGSGLIIWREINCGEGDGDQWKWEWISGCCSVRGNLVQNFPIKGFLLYPILAPQFILAQE